MVKTMKRTLRTILTLSTVTGLASAMLGCTGGGGVSSSGSSSETGTMSVEKVFPSSAGESWTAITSSNRYYIKGLDLTIKGSCTRGIAKIKVNEGGPDYAEEATCLVDGTFTFNKTYLTGQQGDKTLVLTAYGNDNLAVSGATDSVQVRIDNTAPAAPVVTTPASTPHSYTGSSLTFTVNGTAAADVTNMTGPGGVAVSLTGVNWTYDATLVEGASTSYTFYAFDLAGNQSAGTTQVVQWNPSISVLASDVSPGGRSTSAASYVLESSLSFDSTGSNINMGTGYNLESGIIQITNTVRSTP
jgi:hypothetical protein